MFVENLCPPAILYLGFSLTQIIIDLFRGLYNTAMIKIAVTIVFTTVLNMLCKSGLTMISWFIVFIPFVSMTLVTAMLLYIFGLGPFTGKMDYSKINGDPADQNPAVDRGSGPQQPTPETKPTPALTDVTNKKSAFISLLAKSASAVDTHHDAASTDSTNTTNSTNSTKSSSKTATI